jgi:hypothetical protein
MSLIRNARFATLLAVALALVLSSVVAGAAGPTTQRPMKVNSPTGLNADKLDGLDSYDFLRSKTYQKETLTLLGAGTEEFVDIACDPYDRALSGGYLFPPPEGEDAPIRDIFILSNMPRGGLRWEVGFENRGEAPVAVVVMILCADRLPYHAS